MKSIFLTLAVLMSTASFANDETIRITVESDVQRCMCEGGRVKAIRRCDGDHPEGTEFHCSLIDPTCNALKRCFRSIGQ
jgi:hypothetical protein